nr:hypothetical protein [Tanacetum cinerariifolium]
MTTSVVNNSVLKGFFEKQKLTRPNFIHWYQQLRIVLSTEDKLDYLEQPIPPAHVPAYAGQQVAPEAIAAHGAWVKGSKKIAGIMLMTMDSDIQRNMEDLGAYEMSQELKTLFSQQAEQGLLQTMREFHACKHEEGQSVSSYVLKMKSYIDNLEHLRHPISLGLGKRNNKPKKPQSQMAARGQNQKKGKNKLAYAPKPKIPPPPKREDPAKDSICHECGETGHWKRNCPQYLDELLKKKKNTTSGAGGLDHLKDHGIIAHRTPTYMLQHNGVSERRNRTLLDMVRSMMRQTTLPKSFWDYALETAARIFNMVPTKKVEKTPYKETMGYSFYYPPKNKVYVGRNVEFIKNSLIDQEANGSLKDIEIIQKEDTHPSIDTILHHEEDYLEMDEPQKNLGELANYKVALLDPESDIWIDAMNVEIQSMKDNEVWDLVELPPDGKTISSKWLFKKKTDMDGAVHTYKARLVAKGCTQTYKVDYEETFSLVADIRAIRNLLAITAYYDYEIWQIYVKTVFLNRHLYKERFHMENSKRGSIPMQEKLRLMGSIMYVVRCTRLDVAFAHNITSRFQQNPGDLPWTTVKNILKYIRNTKDMFLVYGEAEYIAAYDAFKEAVWVKKFISRLGVVPISEEPINMYWYNTGAITLANESGITKGARNFRAKVHCLREGYCTTGNRCIHYLPGVSARVYVLVRYIRGSSSGTARSRGKDRGFPRRQEAGEKYPQCYTKPLDSLKNWNNRFFWVDERVFPTIVDWRTSAPKDGMPAENIYSPNAVMILNTHRTPIQKQPGALFCLVGLSRRYYLGDEVYPTFLHDDYWGGLIQAPNPTKVKTGTRPRAAREVPLLTVTANRVIEMEDPATTTDSSRKWEKESSYDSPMPRKRSLSFGQSSFKVFSLWGWLLPRGWSLESVPQGLDLVVLGE